MSNQHEDFQHLITTTAMAAVLVIVVSVSNLAEDFSFRPLIPVADREVDVVMKFVEHRVGLLRHMADRQHIEIVEVVIPVQAEVVIADVTAADNSRTSVGNQQLVVHAGVQTLHLRDHLTHA